MYDTSGSQDLYAGLFRDANDSGKFKLFKDLQVEPTTTVNTSGTGYAVGTLVSNLEGNVTGQVSTLSNHDTDNLSEGSSNLYFTNARSRSAISASGDISYNSSTGVISFTQAAQAVSSVNSKTGAVVLDTDDIAEGTSNLYMTTERVQDIVGGMVTGNTETGITVTYDDSDGTLDFVVGTLNQDTTGNAATATALETARAIALSGDVVGTANFDGTAGISISTTIQANSVALGTDTTGDYVSTITAGTGLTSTGATSGEGVAHSLSVDAAQTQITSLGTLTTLTVDDITINGSTISSTPNLILDVEGNIILDANGSEVILRDGGLNFAFFQQVSDDLEITSTRSDADIKFKGNDGGSFVTALTLDMSDAGTAIFNNKVGIGGTPSIAQLDIKASNSNKYIYCDDGTNALLEIKGSTSELIISSQTTGFSAHEDIHLKSNNLMFYQNGSEKARLDGSGRLLIGTDSGDAFNDDAMLRLQRTGDRIFQSFKVDADQEAAIFFGDVDDDVECGIRYQAANRALEFSTGNNSEAMRIDSSGNVGIGTSSPDYKTEIEFVASNHTTGLSITNSQAGGFGSALYFTSERSDNNAHVNAARIRTEGASSWNSDSTTESHLIFETCNNNSLAEKMRINNAGNIGIGTTGAEKRLHITDSTQANQSIRFGNPSATPYGEINYDSSGFEHLYITAKGTTTGFGNIVFNTGATPSEAGRINAKGNFIIGTTVSNPVSIADTRLVVELDSSTSGIAVGADGLVDTRAVMTFYNDNGTVGSITTNGSATAFNTSSDYRLKENVDYTWDATTRLKQLKPARFNFIADKDTTLDGFLAHEVQDIVPEAITGEKDGTEMQGIDQSKLVPLLVKTIQELEARITALES